MTMPKFEPVGYVDYGDRTEWYKRPVPETDLHTAEQLAEAYEAGKLAGIPEGYVLVPKEILDRFPEINPSNYAHEDACNLNEWGIELVLAVAPKGLK